MFAIDQTLLPVRFLPKIEESAFGIFLSIDEIAIPREKPWRDKLFLRYCLVFSDEPLPENDDEEQSIDTTNETEQGTKSRHILEYLTKRISITNIMLYRLQGNFPNFDLR